jgi:hypothetical protein
MAQRMAESMSQQDFYGEHYTALQVAMSKTSEDLFHDSHLQLQERMRKPIISFDAEMMGAIMYLH